MDFSGMTFQQMLIMGLVSMVSSLVMGKFLKKVVLLCIEPLIRKSQTKIDDELLDTAKKDLGVSDTTIDGEDRDGK